MNVPDGIFSIGISNKLVNTMNKNLKELPGIPMKAEKFTMFRVPAHIRKKHNELYEPKMVLIGPYYNGKDTLRAMEKHKWRYLRDYLSRNNANSLEHCIRELRALEPLARRCYFEDVKPQSDEFIMMLVLDGCFIIEFLIKWYSDPDSDMIFNVDWALPVIRSDLLLFENQIPFFVIQKLFGLLTCSCSYPVPAEENASVSTTIGPKIAPLVEILLKYLSDGKEVRPVLTAIEIKHILHLYHLCYVPSVRPNELSPRTDGIFGWLKLCFRRTKSTNVRFPRIIPSATELTEAGVIFKCRQSENILDIKFENGTLEIPFFLIEETQRSRLLSLVTFEQSLATIEQHDNNPRKNLTSYMSFMGGLVRTTRDVTLLQEKGIVENLLATNEELVSFFNWITECTFLEYEGEYLNDLIKNVNTYYTVDWHRWKATLKRDYFSNPWSTISFTAAFVLLVFTALQTLYTILSYY